MNGIIPVHKPAGMTSHDVVYHLRKILQMKKIGHAGTLDPSVDGVLPIAVGRATKAIEFLQESGKIYTGEVTFGFATETEDLDGAVIAREPLTAPFTTTDIDNAMATLRGTITQIPPMYSAVKVNGRRLYDYARAGETVARPERQVTIYRFERTSEPLFDPATGTQKFKFVAEVSKGTYIRTLAVDLGAKLGVPSVMSQLTRQKAGGFMLDEAFTIEQLADKKATDHDLGDWVKTLNAALADYPQIELSDAEWSYAKDGVGLDATVAPGQPARFVSLRHGQVKAVYDWSNAKQKYRPYRTFSNED
ncbi:tRNA pseudouridine(55) synthase TruB [Weissella soli]|uniref:tRNA pseudouridine(55) synthase TruB n=1 Tax=Weissella soli TaxID=155866 RepID=UPI0035A169BA